MDDAELPLPASTSIVIPSAGHTRPGAEASMLERCLQTLSLLDPLPFEVIVVVGDEYRGEPPQPAAGLPTRVVHRGAGPFDFARAVNCGALASRGELVLMLNDDIEAEDSGWLRRMAACLNDPAIGAVGATLLYPDRSIQHIGIEFEDSRPIHSYRGRQLSEVTALAGDTTRDVACVTGACLLARRRDLLAVGGMSLEFPASYGDIDLCLRLGRSGLRTVVAPTAILVHHESASREPVIEPWEWERFSARWGELADQWPNSACLQTGRGDPALAVELVDGDDLDQLRRDVLRMRDQALGAEARIQHQRDRIADQDDQIAELEDRVVERDTRIEEWKDRVAERDARIAERDARIAERDSQAAEKDARIAEKNSRIAGQDARIAGLEAENLLLHEDLARPAIVRIARRIARGPRKNE